MKKSLAFVALLITSFICSMDQPPRSVPTSPRLAPDSIHPRRTSDSPLNPLKRTQRQSFETLPAHINTVNMADTIRRRSVGSALPSQHMDPTTAGQVFEDKRGRSTDQK